MTPKSYITCPDGHFSEGSTCTVCGFTPGVAVVVNDSFPLYIIDPPSGWQYGFPKPYTFTPSALDLTEEQWDAERAQWFLDNGYPQALIDQGMLKYVRSWVRRND